MTTAPIARPEHHFARQNLALREAARHYARSQRTRAESLHDGRALLRHLMLAAMSLGVVVYACVAAGAL